MTKDKNVAKATELKESWEDFLVEFDELIRGDIKARSDDPKHNGSAEYKRFRKAIAAFTKEAKASQGERKTVAIAVKSDPGKVMEGDAAAVLQNVSTGISMKDKSGF